MSHVPVLLNETIEYLNAKKGGKFVDGTIGGGGHARAILQSNHANQVLGIDLDQASLYKLRSELAQIGLDQKVKLVAGNYADINKILPEAGWDKVDGILLDLGFSSLQLDDPTRGFSFTTDGPLDMRYDSTSSITAANVVNQYNPADLEQVISEYGEERFAKRIAGKIIEARKIEPIVTSGQLTTIIRSAIPLPIRFRSNDNIRRVFQAIRIEVNQELTNLKSVLPKMLSALNEHGRLVVISFHSLEDRIVKEFFISEAAECICPPEFPTCICDKTSTIRILTRKPVMAKDSEIAMNPRSKPAKLRAAEKLK